MVRYWEISSCNYYIFSSELLWFLQQQSGCHKILGQYIKYSAIRLKPASVFASKFYGFIFMVDAFCDIENYRDSV